MNRQALFHTQQSEWLYHISTSESLFRFRTAKDDAASVSLVIKPKYTSGDTQCIPMCKRMSDSLFDWHEVVAPTDRGRRYYHFSIVGADGERLLYTENGVQSVDVDENTQYYPHFMIPFLTDADIFRVPDKFRNAVIYQIFPDRFYTRTPKVAQPDWSNKTPVWTDYYGGDLNGISDKLEYLKDLGINTVYMTPVYPSSTSHHYDIEDYYRVSDDFGGDAALYKLVDKAHALGMKVMMDGVFNHCAATNPIFIDVLENGKKSKYYDWFYIDGDMPNTELCNYETFAHNLAYMPKLKSDHRGVIDYVCDVTSYWIKKFGIDAWRLDVAEDVSPTLWREVRKAIKAADSDAIIIAENWRDSRIFLQGDTFDGVMNYLFTRVARDFIAFGKIDAHTAADRLVGTYMSNNRAASAMMMNLIGTHDTPRFYTLCGEDIFKHKAALALMFFYDGMPMVYYGDEVPMSGGPDPDCRKGMAWDRTNTDTAALIKLLASMRLSEGHDAVMNITEQNGALVVTRTTDKRTNTLTLDMAKRTATLDVDGAEYVISGS